MPNPLFILLAKGLPLVLDLAAQASPTASATTTPGAGTVVTVASTKTDMERALTLGAVAFLMGLVLGKPSINWLRDHKIGKHIRIEGPERHQIKTGTPTMGGLIFIIPLVLLIAIFMDIVKYKSLLLPLGIVISCSILGGFDDLLSTVVRNQGGLAARFKMAWLLAISVVSAWILHVPLNLHTVSIPFVKQPIDIGDFYYIVAIVAISGMANAVNLTDGLDTLAGGTSAIAFVSFGVIAYLQNQPPVVYLCFATVGALLAFLWFNAHPAMVFMGDAGSLTLGALLAVAALMTTQWLLLPVIGIVFMVGVLSDILQVLYFKATGGKRLFRIAPIHHHFEMIGWSETQITMRYWLVSMLAGMVGIALALV
ncbi:MAG: phospho-N-acetylmuramoyl-pentapeptide-transferase [Chloroflexota bacterium]|nr:phospho-N-acetylmuramoyl-pentapeptide-transferase [Chloroflexota bacterium]